MAKPMERAQLLLTPYRSPANIERWCVLTRDDEPLLFLRDSGAVRGSLVRPRTAAPLRHQRRYARQSDRVHRAVECPGADGDLAPSVVWRERALRMGGAGGSYESLAALSVAYCQRPEWRFSHRLDAQHHEPGVQGGLGRAGRGGSQGVRERRHDSIRLGDAVQRDGPIHAHLAADEAVAGGM